MQNQNENAAEESLGTSHLLLQAIRSGDNSALGRIADALRPYLKFVIQNEGGHQTAKVQEDPSDLVQQTLVAAIENLPQFRGNSMLEWRGWLAAIARNQVKLAKRYWNAERRTARNEANTNISLGEILTGEDDSPSMAASRSEQLERLKSAVDLLPTDQSQLFRWRNEDGLSHSQIAAKLGITVDASRQRCKAAMDALRVIWRRLDLRSE